MNLPTLRRSVLSLIAFAAMAAAQQQPVRGPEVSLDVKGGTLNSKLMERQMPYEVILPAAYQTDTSKRFPVLYFLHGLSGSHRDAARIIASDERLMAAFQRSHFMIVSVEGGRRFYTDSATVPNDRYESYVIRELLPEIDKRFRTVADRRGRAIYGISMGGYGALKFGIKYAQLFGIAASSIGAVNIASWSSRDDLMKMPAAKLIPTLDKILLPIFGDGGSPTLADNDLFRLLKNLPQDKIASLPFLYLDCGTEDELGLLSPNQQFADMLLARKIPHEFLRYPGTHQNQTWVIADVFGLLDRGFKNAGF